MLTDAAVDRMLAKISGDDPKDCWLWEGGCNPQGYGQFWYSAKGWVAHRLVYEYVRGVIPHGLTLDHLCENKSCVNPWHLEPVTMGENVRRWYRKISNCPRGHAYTPDNTYKNKRKRYCRACKRERRYKKLAAR